MSWLNNYVRPKIRSLVGSKSDVPENLWLQCPSCEQMLFHRDLEDNLNVCSNCGHHMRLPARKRSFWRAVRSTFWREIACVFALKMCFLGAVLVTNAWFLPALVEKFSVLMAMGDWDQAREPRLPTMA